MAGHSSLAAQAVGEDEGPASAFFKHLLQEQLQHERVIFEGNLDSSRETLLKARPHHCPSQPASQSWMTSIAADAPGEECGAHPA